MILKLCFLNCNQYRFWCCDLFSTGTTVESQAEINQWLEYRTTQVDRCAEKKDVELVLEVYCYYDCVMMSYWLDEFSMVFPNVIIFIRQELNKHLADKVFFVDNRLTLADILLYLGLYIVFVRISFRLLHGVQFML